MGPKEVSEFLKAMINLSETPAIFVWGAPGVGKSDVCRQAAFEEGIGFIDLRLTLMDPTDLRGIPIPEEGKARWLPPSVLPTEGRGVLFLDEFNLAPPLVQSSAYQLVLDRRIGEYQLPSGWRIIAAGNKMEQGANVYRMATPMRNRFIHIEFENNLEDWLEWAIKNNIASEVMEFISFRPDLLMQFDPRRQENSFPTPRSWEFVSRIIKNRNGLREEIVEKIIEGAVGGGAAVEFKAYLQMKGQFPEIEEIFAGNNYVSAKNDINCALATALAARAKTKTHFERLISYSAKLPPEIAVLMIKLLAVKDKDTLRNCLSWSDWAKKHSSLII